MRTFWVKIRVWERNVPDFLEIPPNRPLCVLLPSPLQNVTDEKAVVLTSPASQQGGERL